MKALFIINPKSGIKNSKSMLLDAFDVFSNKGYTITTYVTQSKGDAYNYLSRNRINADIICVFGGDGTMFEITNALMHKRSKPDLAYFPSGTMNDFGSNFNLGNDFRKIAEKACEKKARYFDVGQFNDQYFNYVAAFGAMCDVPYTTDRSSKETLGNIAYILEGISKLPNIKKNTVSYTINNKTYDKDVLFGLIYSGNRVAGMELSDKSKAKVDDGLFNVLIVDYVPTIFEAPNIFSILVEQDKFIHNYHTDKITLNFKNKKTVWTIDGEEAKSSEKVEIKIHHKALSLLV